MEAAEIEELLTRKGVKPTPQRMVIADFLLHTFSHPTADEVLAAVENRLPCALSRATVYNTLNSLVAAGVIQEVVTEAGKTRYDANISEHHHFVDRKSGRIFDIPGDMVPKLKDNLGDKFQVHNYQITFYGDLLEDA
ncbi:MAG: transcriptional repressor [Candidatus Obscuribacterales bacterium]|nr:transcriptional repressor [Candidatus Obscuribacterales bacterium]